MVDDLAFVAPGTFLVLLPRTPEAGAQVVSDRLGKGVCELLGAKPESVPMAVMSAETSAGALRSLAETIHPDPVEPAPARMTEPVPAGLDRRSPGAVEAVQEPSE
ncbi:hypothetical protein EG835_06525 [bacterium]|nr:hypothetical protein [bacterium]